MHKVGTLWEAGNEIQNEIPHSLSDNKSVTSATFHPSEIAPTAELRNSNQETKKKSDDQPFFLSVSTD